MSSATRYIGVDAGTRRVGVAVSDDRGSLAVPHATFEADEAVEKIVELAEEIGAGDVVFGWPLELDGRAGRAVGRVEEFIERLERAAEEAKVSLEVHTWDERLTTTAAEAMLIDRDMSRRRRKEVVDQVAATTILQSWLDGRDGAVDESEDAD